MIPTIEEIKARLLSLGYEATEADDAFISFMIDKTEERIKTAINRTDIPEEFKYEFIDEVASNFIQAKLATGGIDVDKVITSISEGDTSVSFDGSKDKTSLLMAHLNDLKISQTMIVKHRRLVW